MDRSPSSKQLDLPFPDAAVLYGVAQRFLSDAEQAQGGIFRDRLRDVPVHKIDLSSILLGKLTTQSLDCRNEPQVIELRRMQLMREKMYVRGNPLRQTAKVHDLRGGLTR